MKRKEFELEWFVYVHGVNCNIFRKMDQRYRKFDVNDQVQYRFENFVDFCWNSK